MVEEGGVKYQKFADEVNGIWEEARSETGNELHNSKILVFDDLVKDDILIVRGEFIEYKYYLAKFRKPEIGYVIEPVGVSGLVEIEYSDERYVLFGRRSEQLTQYTNHYELVPSGSIDIELLSEDGTVDYEGALRREFEEETGVNVDFITSLTTLGLIYDDNSGVYDVCSVIHLNCDLEVVLEGVRNSFEYVEPEFIAVSELVNFIGSVELIVPTSLSLLDLYMNSHKSRTI